MEQPTEKVEPLVIVSAKKYKTMIEDWTRRARELDAPLCHACVKLDSSMGNLQEFEEYTKLEQIGRPKPVYHKRSGKVLGRIVDYKCSRGHGCSVRTMDIESTFKPGEVVGDKSQTDVAPKNKTKKK